MLNLLNLPYTPDGGVADPNHPIYILRWMLNQLGVIADIFTRVADYLEGETNA